MTRRQKDLDLVGGILAEALGGCTMCAGEPDLCEACSAAVDRQVLSLVKAGLLARPFGNPRGRAEDWRITVVGEEPGY